MYNNSNNIKRGFYDVGQLVNTDSVNQLYFENVGNGGNCNTLFTSIYPAISERRRKGYNLVGLNVH